MSKESRVIHSVVVGTTPEMAFEALTSASELREWCSDEARTEVRPGGRYEVRWNSGYRAEGKFVELDPPHRAAITWLGSGEPGETRVEFTVEPAEGGQRVTITHAGFGEGEAWDRVRTESDAGWGPGVENLKSVIETGIDLRIARQPFLGITLDHLTPERAEREGIAAEYGIYITGTVEGGGAAAAGLKNGDVIVALDGAETPTFVDLGAALRRHQAGDVVTVDLVRGQERKPVEVTLAQRPQPDLPDNPTDLADRLAARHAEVDAELRAAVHGLSEEQAAQCPAEGEWSTKQVLAHLSDGERGLHATLVDLAINGWFDAGAVYPDQVPGRLESILVITPALDALLDRFLTDERETVELVRRLPDVTVAHKARFRRIAQFVLLGPDHTAEHIGQIKRCIDAIGGQASPPGE
ncbi:MAG: SRPBCC domain-containing protein [Anaerolineae bacterium]|nr:SRPBCC domain-containing protein [Anaerolineae bacterium]